MPESDKDRYFLQLAYKVAAESDDPRSNVDHNSGVGAVVCRDDQFIVASANRLPPPLRGQFELTDPDAEERYYFIEHAERCAIYDALAKGDRLTHAAMYCTRFPCIDCARTIAYFGLSRLVVGSGFRHEKRWLKSQQAAHRLLRMVGVKIRYMKPPQ